MKKYKRPYGQKGVKEGTLFLVYLIVKCGRKRE
jgi:hypothetical protein